MASERLFTQVSPNYKNSEEGKNSVEVFKNETGMSYTEAFIEAETGRI